MSGILPRVVCETCGRSIAVVAAGTPRSHRVNGDPCPGSGTESGTCPVCGRVAPLERNGTLARHKEIRVRARRTTESGLVDVEPETYSTKRDCSGAGQLPELSEGPDFSDERFPTFSEVNRERWQ